MFDPNSPLPDFTSQNAEVQHQQALAQMLRAQAQKSQLPQGSMVGNRFVRPGIAEYLPMLLDRFQAAYQGNKADEATKAYGASVDQARNQWQKSLPQMTPGAPGHPEFPGPRDETGSPELNAAPPTQPQLPDRGSVLRATMAGMAIPGNEHAAQNYSLGMGQEIQREDNQAEKRDSQAALFKQQKELEATRLADKAAADKLRSEDTRLSIEQRREAAKDAAEGRRMHDETLRAIASMKADKPKDLKPLPSQQSKAWVENGNLLGQIDDARSALKANPDAVGYKGVLPNWAVQRIDPKGNDARIKLGRLSSAQIKDMSGTAVSGAEFERIRPWIPNSTDDAKTATKKLDSLESYVKMHQNNILDYADTQGYKPPGSKFQSDAPAPSVANSKTIGGKTYTQKDGQWYEQ